MGQIKNIKLHIVTDIKSLILSISRKLNYISFSTEYLLLGRLVWLLFIIKIITMSVLQKLIPLFDRVLVQRLVAETSTKGGILLPEKSVGKMLEGTVIAVGEGTRDQTGDVVPLSVSVGDSVLLPQYGGTKLEMDDQEYMLFKESELLGKFTNS